MQRYRDGLHEDNVFMHQHRLIDNLLQYLSLEAGLRSTEKQLSVLRASVSERVGGIINADDFAERLILSPEMGGAQYTERESELISWNLEKLIAQGGYVIQPNELLGGHT